MAFHVTAILGEHKMKAIKGLELGLLICLIVAVLSCIFTVREGNQVLLLRLGKIEVDTQGKPKVYQPGIHFKLPFITQARYFDVRLQTLAIESSRIVTEEKKDVLVDYYVKWRVNNLPVYYTRTNGDSHAAEVLLEQQINDGLRAQFGRRTIKEVVANERADIMELLRKKANQRAAELGIDVVDVRLKGIDLPDEVSAAVFERMRAERERVAAEHRSEGKAQAEAIRAQADANVTITLAKAKSEAIKLRGEGDAQAAKIYASAYNKDPKFYSFYQSLLAYGSAFKDKKDILVLSPDSQFFKYFNNIQGSATESK
jgi:membrane protease subunit HflC